MRLYERWTNSIAVILLAVTTLLCACEKTDEQTGGTDGFAPTGRCLLETPLIGVVPFGGGSPQTRAALQMEEQRQAFNTGEELGNIITLGNSEVEDTPQTRADDGIYYRIVVYTLEEWNKAAPKILEQRLCKTGSTEYVADLGDSTEPIYLYPGDYRIFCYSFNKTTMDKMAKLADGAVNVPLTEGDDFLSADVISKNIAASQLGTNVALGTITLKHRCCRLIGTLKAEGFLNATGIAADPVPTYSVTSIFSKEGNWSIKGTTFSSTTTATESKSFALTESGNDYTGTFLVLPLTSQSFKATYTFMPNGATKGNVTATDKLVSSSMTFASGGSYTFTIKALGSYVITDGVEFLKIGDYTWATRNVRYNNTFETNLDIWNSGNLRGAAQASTANEGVNSDYNSYFMWGYKTAFVSSASAYTGSSWSSNPCPSDYKVPTQDQLNNLITKKMPNGKKVSINGEVHTIGNNYGFYNGSKARGLVLIDGDNVLFLPAAGDRYGTVWNNVGSLGYYWTSAPSGSYAYGLYFDTGRCGVSTGNRRNGYSVRCVKG